MKKINRREALGALSAFSLMGMVAEAQTGASSNLTVSKIYKYADLPVTHNAGGAARRAVPADGTPSGTLLNVHLTTIDPGKDFAPMHKNPDHEMLFVHEGTLELVHQGKPTLTGKPGDILFSAANEMHTTRNPGTVPVTYFVAQIKGPAK